ncbi:MAG: ribosome small subunit-dependent GTPase A [Alphaproteobacteria bacterium]
MTFDASRLAMYGWSNHFQSQLSAEEMQHALPVRVAGVHRSGLDVIGPGGTLRGVRAHFGGNEDAATVGDWLLLDSRSKRPLRVLDRRSLVKRRAAGRTLGVQLIAANLDTLFIVTSCNEDFSIARLERYLAVAREADVMPVVVLTKADMVAEASGLVEEARSLLLDLVVEAVDARDGASVKALEGWCVAGQTIAMLGSSGVGKTTLTNTLVGAGDLATAEIREDDSKGRHITTARAMYRLSQGGWVIDTPGMRELQLTDVADGLSDVFEEIIALASLCRFRDCQHDGEPGCAVRQAVDKGELDPDRLSRYKKLLREEAHNTESIQHRRERNRQFAKMARGVVAEKSRKRDQ